jgi:hypothetical protein
MLAPPEETRMDRMTRFAIAATLCLPLAAVGAEKAPPSDDLPSPEQIEQVTKTKPMAGLEEEAPAELDTITIDATRKVETAYRTVAVALDRVRSDKVEDADVVVCQKRQKIGSHITKVYCATNRTWNYIRKVSTRDTLGPMNTVGAPYALVEGPVYELSPSALAKIGKQFPDGDHADRLAQLAAEDSVGRLKDEWDTPTDTVVRFAKAFAGVSKASKSGDAKSQERAMDEAIAAHGFSIDQYNDLVSRLETSGMFQRRVAAATQAYKL